MACFCAAGIAHFYKLPRLACQRQVIFLPIAWIGPPPLRPLSKTIQPAFAAFCPVSKLHPFFCSMHFFSTNQPSCKIALIFTFFICLQKSALFCVPQFQGRFWLFYFRACLFKKQYLFCVRQKSGSILSTQKEGGIFHFKPPKQHLKLKFIFLKSTQNLWKGFLENLTMCHILSHFARKQCAFFN